MSAKEIKYEVVKHIGVVSESENYTKELNLVAWNGRKPTFDLRVWKRGKDNTSMPLKGVSMNTDDILVLKELLSNLNLENEDE